MRKTLIFVAAGMTLAASAAAAEEARIGVGVGPVGAAGATVPAIAPAALKVRPLGRLPPVTVNVYGGVPPFAVSVLL